MEEQTKNFVKSVHIENFKSLKSVDLTECRQINVLIGRPGGGKSNIVEALALFDIPYLAVSPNLPLNSLNKLVRLENVADLFYNGRTSSPIKIQVGDNLIEVYVCDNDGNTLEISSKGKKAKYQLTTSLGLTAKKSPSFQPFHSDILAYYFPEHIVSESDNINANFLIPPYGSNLIEILSKLHELKSDLERILQELGLKLKFDEGKENITGLDTKISGGYGFTYKSLSESLRRLIFYRCAIESNHNKLICFEEPEAHCFPPIISLITEAIIDCPDNQFFITTHSPHIMTSLLEKLDLDLAVFIVELNNGETVIQRLSENQLQEAYDKGIDMFYNLGWFTDK